MTPHEHLQMLINRAYFEDDGAYRALMAQRDVEVGHGDGVDAAFQSRIEEIATESNRMIQYSRRPDMRDKTNEFRAKLGLAPI